jgi:Arc/MetJ-type ribon-helix-helix transcriptional regulator
MRNTTIHLPQLYLKLIDEILREKEYPCTSEFIRVAIRKMLKRDTVLLHNPRLEQSSEEVKEFVAKQRTRGIQRNLDSFTLMLEQNPGLQRMKEIGKISIPKKQARIDSFWK